MAPSTTNPSSLRRAPFACLRCRAAKVRCVISKGTHRCDRCVANNFQCVITKHKRTRARAHPYTRARNRPSISSQEHVEGPTREPLPSRSTPQSVALNETAVSPSATTAFPRRSSSFVDYQTPNASYGRRTLINADVRARIVAALSSLKGKRGSPFGFVTGDTPSFDMDVGGPSVQERHQQKSPTYTQFVEPSLKLSNILRPFKGITRQRRSSSGNDENDNDEDYPLISAAKMPSYFSSLTLGQTINDPIESGILTRQASKALFGHFLLEMNAKWEYIVDPRFDTHDSVQRRSRFLFTTILFCSSKFAQSIDGRLVPSTDIFLQSRLCSLARNLAIRAFAEGDRSLETMQAFYLLACWKEPDDDISYLHSGYAMRILNDLNWELNNDEEEYMVRRKRVWLALFRQDRQQSLFFMRRAVLGSGDDERPSFVSIHDNWLKMRHILPLDFISCCNVDIRQIQARMHLQVKKASLEMLPCLADLLDFELRKWKSTWRTHFLAETKLESNDDPSFDLRLLYPGGQHVNTIVELWEQSVRLNVSSAILRQALMNSVTSSVQAGEQLEKQSQPLQLDLTAVTDVLSTDVAGLSSSVEGAFGTLRQLLSFPVHDLRRSPDSVLLLGPNAALYLCLLLCLPPTGVLGPSFQETAVSLIKDIARHMRQAIQSSQDIVVLHAAYLDSLVRLLEPETSRPLSPMTDQLMVASASGSLYTDTSESMMPGDETTSQAALGLAGDTTNISENEMNGNSASFSLSYGIDENLDIQSLVNLLDPGLFMGTQALFADDSVDL